MKINIRPLSGNWTHGWALDQHTVNSTTGDTDSFDAPNLDSEQAGIGAAIFRLKFRDDLTQVEPIARTVAEFIRGRSELADIESILAVPPSEWRRSYQPVEVVAARIGELLGLPVPEDYLLKAKPTKPLQGITDRRPRPEELNDAFSVLDKSLANQHVLLFDDIYRFGQTLKAATVALLFQGNVAMVSVVTATSIIIKTSPNSGDGASILA
jgi:predicted amidophosphoribosyltransferase